MFSYCNNTQRLHIMEVTFEFYRILCCMVFPLVSNYKPCYYSVNMYVKLVCNNVFSELSKMQFIALNK